MESRALRATSRFIAWRPVISVFSLNVRHSAVWGNRSTTVHVVSISPRRDCHISVTGLPPVPAPLWFSNPAEYRRRARREHHRMCNIHDVATRTRRSEPFPHRARGIPRLSKDSAKPGTGRQPTPAPIVSLCTFVRPSAVAAGKRRSAAHLRLTSATACGRDGMRGGRGRRRPARSFGAPHPPDGPDVGERSINRRAGRRAVRVRRPHEWAKQPWARGKSEVQSGPTPRRVRDTLGARGVCAGGKRPGRCLLRSPPRTRPGLRPR